MYQLTNNQGLGYVYIIPDSFCAAQKIIPDRDSVHTQERLSWRDFCDEEKLCRADLESGASVTYRIGFFPYFGAV